MVKTKIKDWFGSTYYATLYQNRSESEAQAAILALLQHLKISKNSQVLDLGCGKGRHAGFLHQNGLQVTGVDFSADAIAQAKTIEKPGLQFFIHDMRLPFREQAFDVVFNFFTSFGYFQTQEEHLETLKNVHRNLKPEGLFVMDFLNATQVKRGLVRKETLSRGGITFHLTRTIRHGRVYKTIEIPVFSRENTSLPEKTLWFREQVRLFEKEELEAMLKQAGLVVLESFGDYSLDHFIKEQSPRLILICQKAN